MQGDDRRRKIIKILDSSSNAVSGGNLACILGVSRQVIVQDIALLRAQNLEINSTNKGYIINNTKTYTREIKVKHSDEDIENELNTIVDLGGKIKDVSVYHDTYGKLSANLDIKSRHDVGILKEELDSGKSTPLKNLTKDYHYHIIEAESKEILDLIESKLHKKGYLIR